MASIVSLLTSAQATLAKPSVTTARAAHAMNLVACPFMMHLPVFVSVGFILRARQFFLLGLSPVAGARDPLITFDVLPSSNSRREEQGAHRAQA